MPTQRISQILRGDLVFILLHEVGHGLFDIHKIPVLGMEEDAADKFAAFLLLSTGGASVLRDATIFMPLIKMPWFKKALGGPSIYGDEHAFAEQRLANIICQGLGKDPQGFMQAATEIRLPQHRIQRCPDEFNKLARDVHNLLGGHLNVAP